MSLHHKAAIAEAWSLAIGQRTGAIGVAILATAALANEVCCHCNAGKQPDENTTMYHYISQFFSGGLDETWPHFILLIGTILGGLLVGLGVILEAEKIWSIPTLCVFGGIVIEAAFTLALFGFDEGITNAQQSKIIALEKLLAPRHVPVEDRSLIFDAVQPFGGQQYRGSVSVDVADALDLWREISVVLGLAHWQLLAPIGPPVTKKDWGRPPILHAECKKGL